MAAVLLKWALLGKVKPGMHALWSCWCSRWDFHYVLWGEWARPLLNALEGTLLLNACQFLHCQIELPAQIESISIESNELQTLATDQNVFSLAIQLQNKSNTLQSWPMLELTLNDRKDKPVLRRVFTPNDYLPGKNDITKGFTPGSEQAIKLYFELSGVKAAGYHVGVFYP